VKKPRTRTQHRATPQKGQPSRHKTRKEVKTILAKTGHLAIRMFVNKLTQVAGGVKHTVAAILSVTEIGLRI
jgi:hypothetical protein